MNLLPSFSIESLQDILGINCTNKDSLLTILYKGFKKEDLNFALANSKNITDETFSRFKNRILTDDEIIFHDTTSTLETDSTTEPISDLVSVEAPITEVNIDIVADLRPPNRHRCESEESDSAPIANIETDSAAFSIPTLLIDAVDDSTATRLLQCENPDRIFARVDKSIPESLGAREYSDLESATMPMSDDGIEIDADEQKAFVQRQQKEYYNQCMMEVSKISKTRDQFQSKLHVLLRSQAEKVSKNKNSYNYFDTNYQFHKKFVLPMCQHFNIDYDSVAQQVERKPIIRPRYRK